MSSGCPFQPGILRRLEKVTASVTAGNFRPSLDSEPPTKSQSRAQFSSGPLERVQDLSRRREPVDRRVAPASVPRRALPWLERPNGGASAGARHPGAGGGWKCVACERVFTAVVVSSSIVRRLRDPALRPPQGCFARWPGRSANSLNRCRQPMTHGCVIYARVRHRAKTIDLRASIEPLQFRPPMAAALEWRNGGRGRGPTAQPGPQHAWIW
jgi:hypothetical protein